MTFNWDLPNNVSETFAQLFNKELLSDIKFEFQNDKKIYAHSFVLAARGSGFHDCFQDSIGISKLIPVIDVSYDAMYTFLKYIYTDDITFDAAFMYDFLKLSVKYGVKYVESKSVNAWIENFKAADICEVLHLSLKEKFWELHFQALRFICEHSREVLNSDAFIKSDREVLTIILDCDNLKNIDDVEIFEAVLKWVNHACTAAGLTAEVEAKRSMLGAALNLVRFTSMTEAEFERCRVMQPGLLTADEINAIEYYQARQLGNTLGFTKRRRNTHLELSFNSRELEINDHLATAKRRHTETNFEAEFTVSKPIILTAIGIYEAHCNVTLTIVSNGDKIRYKRAVQTTREGFYNFGVFAPVRLAAKETYKILYNFSNVVSKDCPGFKVQYVYPYKITGASDVDFTFSKLADNIFSIGYSVPLPE